MLTVGDLVEALGQAARIVGRDAPVGWVRDGRPVDVAGLLVAPGAVRLVDRDEAEEYLAVIAAGEPEPC